MKMNYEEPCLIIKDVCNLLQNIGDGDGGGRPTISLGHGDPSLFSCLRTSHVAKRRDIAGYLSHDLPYELSPDDVYVTSGSKQSIQVVLAAFARGSANVLLPTPGHPRYESNCSFNSIEAWHYDLLPDKSWEGDLSSVEALADESTAAIVIINPGNPCGNVYSSQHLKQIAEIARKLGIVVIADEVYGHLCFGDKPFVPMDVFGSIVPVITRGSISRQWVVPCCRLGGIVKNDPNQMLLETGILEAIKMFLEFSAEPATFIQAELDFSFLKNITDDMDFCLKLAKEEHVIIVPGNENELHLCFGRNLQSTLPG